MTQIHIEAKPLSPEQVLAHEHAIQCAKKFHAAEKALLLAIMEVDRLLIYEEFGEAYLTPYCVKYLKLSEDVAGTFVRVARRAAELPELRRGLLEGRISITKARLIASLLTPKNCESWLKKAENMSRYALEREVAANSPADELPELVKPIGKNRVRVRMDLSKNVMDDFVRARQLVSEKKKRRHNYAATLRQLIVFYLSKKIIESINKRSSTRPWTGRQSFPLN